MPAPSPLPAVLPSEQFYTSEDVARRFKVSEETARGWMTQGPLERRLGHFRRGRVFRTTEALLLQFFAANEVTPPRAPRTSLLEKDVIDRTVWLIGELVRTGRVQVLPHPTEPERDHAA